MSFTFFSVKLLKTRTLIYDLINDFWIKQCLKEKIGMFMERKECKAEGKTSACQKKNKLYFSYVLQNFHKKKYTYQM